MTNKTFHFLCYITLSLTLIIVYSACFKYAKDGYGYPGYRGYHHCHSHWYIRHYDQSMGSSVRENSLSGSRYSQKGINGGK